MTKAILLLALSTLVLVSAKPTSPVVSLEKSLVALQQSSSLAIDFMNGFAHGAQNSTVNLCLSSFEYIGAAWDNFLASIEDIGSTLDNLVPAISYLRFWADAVRDNVTNCKYAILLRLWLTLLDPANLAEYTIKYLAAQDQFNPIFEQLTADYFNGNWYGVGFDIGAGFSQFTNFAY